jgi:hypothetical protein
MAVYHLSTIIIMLAKRPEIYSSNQLMHRKALNGNGGNYCSMRLKAEMAEY